MKLLSDFDGVWTYPDEEGAAHGAALDAALVAVAGEGAAGAATAEDVVAGQAAGGKAVAGDVSRDAVRAWVTRAREAVRAEPGRWGWLSEGRLSAFADEDPFTEHGALLHYLHERRAEDPLAARLAAGIEATGKTLDAFGGDCHVSGVRKVESRRGPGITSAAAAAGHALLAAGTEVVVVSNSGTEKLARWFAHAGVPSRVHPERVERELRLRGSAKKYALAPEAPAMLEVGSLRIDTARPFYEQVLREERPDAVVGDVFSLDLALPLALKRRDPAWRHVRLFWLVHPYTPSRLRHEIDAGAPGEVEAIAGGLPAVAARVLSGG